MKIFIIFIILISVCVIIGLAMIGIYAVYSEKKYMESDIGW